MNICKIESIIPGKPWTSQHGTMHSFTIVFADGIRGEANAKTNPPPYKVGEKVGYEIAGTTPIGTNKLKIDRKADPALCRDTTPPEAPDFEAAVPKTSPPPARTPTQTQTPRSVPQNGNATPLVNGATVGGALARAVDIAIYTEAIQKGGWGDAEIALVEKITRDLVAIQTRVERGEVRQSTRSAPRQTAPARPPQENLDEDIPF